ncbi:hypothetical protein OUZ56_024972 [Daphnia magna]|uniref:Uncharacterized protein n=1 Tax=Daphnia magna TaxID=35525 RepID=A0ABQ9ZII7_9CRUS|nr:hypothetical protein OUZ56_024972 [Daphnia magna]
MARANQKRPDVHWLSSSQPSHALPKLPTTLRRRCTLCCLVHRWLKSWTAFSSHENLNQFEVDLLSCVMPLRKGPWKSVENILRIDI